MKTKTKLFSFLATFSLFSGLSSCKSNSSSTNDISTPDVILDETKYDFVERSDGAVEIKKAKDTNIINLRIPDYLNNKKVVSVDSFAFSDCKHIKNVFIGKFLEKIDGSAFSNVEDLESFKIDKENPFLEIVNNCVFEKQLNENNQHVLVLGCKSSVIPDNLNDFGTIKIASHAFYESNIISIDLPETVINIDVDAYINNKKVKKITSSSTQYKVVDDALITSDGVIITMVSNKPIPIKAEVTSIGQYAFYKSEIESIFIPNNITSFYSTKNSPNYAFSYSSVKDVNFAYSSTIKSLSKAFSNTKIESFSAPDSLTSIDEDNFENCSELKVVKLYSNVNIIDRKAFLSCPNIQQIIFLQPNRNYEVIDNCLIDLKNASVVFAYSTNNIVIPKTTSNSIIIDKIDDYAFSNLKNIESISLTSNIKNIGAHAFDNTSAKNIYLPDSIISIGEYAFKDTKLEEPLNLPNNSSLKLGNYPFYNATINKLKIKDYCNYNSKTFVGGNFNVITVDSTNKNVKINGNNLLSIDNSYLLKAFGDLSNYSLDSTIQYIEQGAFSNTNIKSLTLSDNIHRIEDDTFLNSSLENIKLSDNIIYIGNNAFMNTKLKHISIPSKVSSLKNAFALCTDLVVNIDTNNKYYKVESNCIVSKDGKNLVEGFNNSIIPSSVETIAENAFYKVKFDNPFVIPLSVKSIKENAFKGSALESIVLSDKLLEVGENAFGDANSLSFIEIKNPNLKIYSDSLASSFKNTSIKTLRFHGTIDEFKSVFTKNEFLNLPDSLSEIELIDNDNNIKKISRTSITY